MKSEKRKLDSRLKNILPYIIVSVLWTLFSLWICIRENELAWSLILISIGLIPLFWNVYISPKLINKTDEVNRSFKGEKSILSFVGRIRRKTYWIRVIAVVIIANILRFIINNNPENMGLFMSSILINSILSVFVIVQGVKRMHDVNKSGWYILIPIYGLILALTEGTKGKNEYGDDPKSK